MINKKILIIDDEPELVKAVEIRLKANGYEVEGAYDGKAGIDKAEKFKPDLVLLDIMMPGMDGQEVLKKLKENPETKTIPVIMLSAKSEAGDIVKSLVDGGACDYIVKPFFDGEMLRKLKSNINAVEGMTAGLLLDSMETKVREFLNGK
ncbi:MAG: response regulator [Candidatus Omnitrophica bacterium]|nr:response regulator [Candidatus Omnitrophota bacterium]